MSLINRFEDIQAWQEARELVKKVYVLTNKEPFSEVQSLLYAALDVECVNQRLFDLHYEQARKTKALIGGFKHSLTKKSFRQ